ALVQPFIDSAEKLDRRNAAILPNHARKLHFTLNLVRGCGRDVLWIDLAMRNRRSDWRQARLTRGAVRVPHQPASGVARQIRHLDRHHVNIAAVEALVGPVGYLDGPGIGFAGYLLR